MAEEINKSQEYGQAAGSEEIKDRGLFDFLGKKDDDHKEKPKPADHHHDYQHQEPVIVSEFDQKVTISEPEPEHHHHGHHEEPPKHEECKVEHKKEDEEKKPSLLEKLHRSNSSSSSSSDEEEVGEDGEKRKKKKKEKKGLKEKIFGDKSEEKKEEKYEDTAVPIEKYDDAHEQYQGEEKKGFLEKIKEKLPGQGKKSGAEETVVVAPASSAHEYSHEHHQAAQGDYQEAGKEKKGFLEKIKEKIPGYHKSDDEKEKEKEKEKECH